MTRPLMKSLEKLLEEMPGSDADELLPHCSGRTRDQVLVALQNLAAHGRARCELQGVRSFSEGRRPGRYYLISSIKVDHGKPSHRAVSSVFELGARA